MPLRMKSKIIFLVGPTAVGKSEIAVDLAKRINAEIISCDSMQIYKGMEIISSQPSVALRKKVKHHLVSIVSSTKDYNAAKYRQAALKKIKEILRRGKIPLFAGGSGLYISVLVDGIFKANSQNEAIRRQLYEEASRFGSSHLYEKLQAVDAEAALKIHPHDIRRMVRALEVFEVCKKPISQLQKKRKGLFDKYDVRTFCLDMKRSELYQRIEKRVDEMFNKGILNEVRRLLRLKLSKTAPYAIGIKELKGYFAGLYDLEETKRLMKKNTRNYAKRQLTWFKKDKRIEWIRLDEKETPAQVARRIFRSLTLRGDYTLNAIRYT